MAELNLDGDDLQLTLSSFEKAESLHSDIRVPISAVRDVQIVDDVIHAVHGIKFPGARWPGKLAVGTFVTLSGTKVFAVIHHDTPRGLRVVLDGATFDEIIVGSDDPEAMKARIPPLP